MKHFKHTLLFITAFLMAISAAMAQDTSTQGTEFWVSYMGNGHKYHTGAPNSDWILTQLLISGKRDCSGTINNPQTGWSTDFTVHANTITTVEIPESQAYVDELSEQKLNKGLQIITDDTVSVFCTNIAHLSFDASYVMPIQSLADEYIVQTYDQSSAPAQSFVKRNQTSAFLVMATEDNTTIDITPAVKTLNGHSAGQTFTVTMNKGQVYQVRSDNSDGNSQRDLSGSRVFAHDGKPIAVFNGNTLTCIPQRESSYDHIFEQAMPIRSWGKKFVVTSSLQREKDYIKVTSASDNNNVFKNGQQIATLQAYESYIFEMPNQEGSCFLETTNPSAVYLYHTSRDGSSRGDPSVLWIAPIEQRIDEITFTTFNDDEYASIDDHYVNIIVNRNDIGNVYLDGSPLPTDQFHNVNGSDLYSYARKKIQHGVHHLECFGGFNAHVYGFGIAKGYAYLVGSKTIDLTTRVFMNQTLVPKEGTYSYCPDATITFEAEVNLENASILWDFGDGTTSTQNPVTHTYADKRVYEVVLTATAKGAKSNEVSHYFVDTRTNTITENDGEICIGDHYIGHGLDVVIANDTVIGIEVDNPIHPVCKDSLLIYVTALPGYYAAYEETLCWRDEPIVYTDHGFNLIIDHPDTYIEHVETPIPGGCDSIIDLTLTVTERIISPFGVVFSACAESFTFNDVTYTQNGIYEQVFISESGCDSVLLISVTLDETLEGGTDTVTGGCLGYEWHGKFYDASGFYTDTVTNTLGCDSIVHLDLHLTPPPDPTEIQPLDTLNPTPHMVISASEFDIHSYEFTIADNNPDAAWDSVEWSFETDIAWILEPFGENNCSCRVIVLNREEDTVWLHARVIDPCNPGESIDRRFWLLCTFYGIGEDNPSTSSGTLDFTIVPNPNKGEMSLLFGEMEGPATLKVYDMTGLLVDQTVLHVTPQSRTTYSLENKACGVYLMVLQHKGSTRSNKVVVIR